jgi:hypothetical protein
MTTAVTGPSYGSIAVGEMSGAFNRYIGIDYSGAETCDSSLKGLRVYIQNKRE